MNFRNFERKWTDHVSREFVPIALLASHPVPNSIALPAQCSMFNTLVPSMTWKKRKVVGSPSEHDIPHSIDEQAVPASCVADFMEETSPHAESIRLLLLLVNGNAPMKLNEDSHSTGLPKDTPVDYIK